LLAKQVVLALVKIADHALDGMDGARRVERRQDEVPGLGGLDGDFDRLGVAHLPHEDDIRIHAHGLTQGNVEVRDVLAQLALADDGLAACIHVFDRVFDRNDAQSLDGVDVSIIVASVVVFPEPVMPVSSTSPRGFLAMVRMTSGNSSSSMVGTVSGIRRIVMPSLPIA
jgi:hypothetical protein